MTFPPEVWAGALRRLAEIVPEFSLESWLHPIAAVAGEDQLRLVCPTLFHKERVSRHFQLQIAQALEAEAGRPVPISLEVRSAADSTAPVAARRAPQLTRPTPEARSTHADTNSARNATAQRNFSYDFGSFVTGEANALAREASLALARGQHRQLRQLYLASPAGLGKTHLSRAAVTEAREQKVGRVVYAPAEAFVSEFTTSVRTKQMTRFRSRFRQGCALLVVEDLQHLQGKRGTQLELFHTIAHVLDTGGRVLLTGRALPQEMEGLEADLRSQLAGSFVAELAPPDRGLRRAILAQKAASGGVRLPDACAELLVDRLRGSVRELESALEQVVTTAALIGRRIDTALVQEVLESKGAVPRREGTRPSPETVLRIVASLCGTRAEALASRSRRRDVMLPRQIAMVLCRRFTDASIAEIGRAFGRSHTSVRNALTKIERDMLARAPLRYRVESIARRVEQWLGDEEIGR